MLRIVLIGPVYPYKGGIAHYTGLLYQALKKEYDVVLVSYKMQYPKFLYKKEQKDYSDSLFRIESTRYLLNTANPFNIVRVGLKIKGMRPDLVIFQWWHPYFAPCYRILESVLGKGVRKLFICHNLFPHERFPLDCFLTGLALKQGDAFLVHSESDGKDLRTMKPDARYRQNPHPTYNVFRKRGLTKAQAREELGLPQESKVLLFFGFIRKYKGLKHLLDAMPKIARRIEGARLLIVGSFSNDKEDYMRMIRENKIADCVEVMDGYVPDNEVEKYFAACDLVVCPYESATQSGIVQIAYGFEKPVIATNVGGLPDIVADRKTGYIVQPNNPNALADAVTDFYENDREKEYIKNIRETAYEFSWERLVHAISELTADMGGVD